MIHPVVGLICAILKASWLYLWRLGSAHIRACKQPFDTIVNAPREVNLTNRKSQLLAVHERQHPLADNGKFFFAPFMIYVIYFVDTVWILYSHDFNYPAEPMPELLGHKMFPRMFWPNSDVILNVAMGSVAVQYYHLWRRPWLDQRYIMYAMVNEGSEHKFLLINRKVWNRQNSAKLFHLQARYHYLINYVYIGTYAFGICYFNYHYLNRPWSDGWKDWTTFALYLNQMIWYNFTANIYMFFHFVFILQYIIAKQKHLINRMKNLVDKFGEQKLKRNDKQSLTKLWRQFQMINTDLAYQCGEIRAYNRFWSIQLSMQFVFSVIVICYSAYCNLFLIKVASIEGMAYFVLIPIEFAFMMFTVIYECSLVDRVNKHIYGWNVKLCMMFQFHFDNNIISPRMLATIETISTNRNFSRCCFRLVNGYRLDSTAFNMAIYIISTLFIMIAKRNEYYQKSQTN